MVWIPSWRCYGMIHKMLMAAAGAGGAAPTTNYDIANIAYSGTAGTNYQSLAPIYDLAGEGSYPINSSPIVYDMELFNNGQGILGYATANVPSGFITADFEGGNYQIGTNGMFDDYKFFKPGAYTFGRGTHWVDSTTIFSGYKDFSNNFILKKYSLSSAWDISTFNTTAVQTLTLPAFTGTQFTGLKFNSAGTKFFVFTDAEVSEFNLTSAYDLTTFSNPNKTNTGSGYSSVHMNAAGTRIFYSNSLFDNNVRSKTLSSGFDLSTLSGSETVIDVSTRPKMANGNICGLAMNEADSNYSAGELVFLAGGWSSRTTVLRGVMSTPYDMSTVTWDPPLQSGAKIGIMEDASANNPVEYIRCGNAYMPAEPGDVFTNGRYLAHVEYDQNNTYRKEAFSFPTQFTVSSLAPYAETERTNVTTTDVFAMGYTRNRHYFFTDTGSGSSQVINFEMVNHPISTPNDPAFGTVSTVRDVTTWAKDQFNSTDNLYMISSANRTKAEYDSNLNSQRRIWVLVYVLNQPGGQPYYIKRMSSTTSNSLSNPSSWTLDTGATNIWQVPFGGTNDPVTGEFLTSLTVSNDGSKFLIMSGASKLYLYTNSDPWNLNGTITLAQTATLPLPANSMPRNAWYNDVGTKLFVQDTTGFVYEYDCGT